MMRDCSQTMYMVCELMAQLLVPFLPAAFLFFARGPFPLLALLLQLLAFCLSPLRLGGSHSPSPSSSSVSFGCVAVESPSAWESSVEHDVCSRAARRLPMVAPALGFGLGCFWATVSDRELEASDLTSSVSRQVTLCNILARSFTRGVPRFFSHSGLVRWFVRSHSFFCPGTMIRSISGSVSATEVARVREPGFALLSGRLRLMYASCCSESFWKTVSNILYRRPHWSHLRRDGARDCPITLVPAPFAYHLRTRC